MGHVMRELSLHLIRSHPMGHTLWELLTPYLQQNLCRRYIRRSHKYFKENFSYFVDTPVFRMVLHVRKITMRRRREHLEGHVILSPTFSVIFHRSIEKNAVKFQSRKFRPSQAIGDALVTLDV